MKIEKEKEEKDYDYGVDDILDYYSDDETSDNVEKVEQSILNEKQPKFRRTRSKYSNGIRVLEIIATLMEKTAEYSVQIHSDTNEITAFRKHKGSLATIYYIIKPMFGSLVTDKIEKIEKAYTILIKRYTSNSTTKNYDQLLKVAKLYEEKMQQSMILTNVSLETERTGSGPVARSKIMS